MPRVRPSVRHFLGSDLPKLLLEAPGTVQIPSLPSPLKHLLHSEFSFWLSWQSCLRCGREGKRNPFKENSFSSFLHPDPGQTLTRMSRTTQRHWQLEISLFWLLLTHLPHLEAKKNTILTAVIYSFHSKLLEKKYHFSMWNKAGLFSKNWEMLHSFFLKKRTSLVKKPKMFHSLILE